MTATQRLKLNSYTADHPTGCVADLVTLDRHNGDVQLRFLSKGRAQREGSLQVSLSADVAEQLLSMLSREFDKPAWY